MQTSARPAWAERLRFWLTDGQYSRLLSKNAADWRWELPSLLETVGTRALCMVFRHMPIPDQCGKPEHDYCACCEKPTPGMAERVR